MREKAEAADMRVEVDFDRCEGHGFCEESAPELFELADNGELILKRSDVPEELLEKAIVAARACPVAAIKLLGSGG
jgi:ferredoxin